MINFNIIFSFALAYLVTVSVVPLIRVLAFKMNAVDVPKDSRRMHKKPIPRWGGIGIFSGFLVSVICFTEIIDFQLLAILAGSLIIVITGILDDKYALSAWVKLLGQILATVIVLLAGIRINIFTNPFPFGEDMINLSYLSIPITFIWIIVMTNAINLIDGLDGLAASISGISSLALLIVCLLFGKTDMAAIIAAVGGACFGFLPHNSHPAKIFMGDSGALFLGFILATLSVQGFFKGYAAITFVIPVIILALPIFDTSFAILRRLYKKQGIMSADRGHLHHRLVDLGFSHRETVRLLTTFSALLSITAIVITTKGIKRALVLIAAMILFAISIRVYHKNKNIASEYMEELEENGRVENEKN